ncbi:MAG: hypothetical protein ICV64_02175 [Thermoleophilia bacterium]|nr:hypothetical protein [Thermoleophilia bacterium]
MALWRLCERVGVDVGATEGPPYRVDAAQREAFERVLAEARQRDGLVDLTGCPYPAHELLTYVAVEHRLLLHGSNDTALEVLEPRPARDFDTELLAVVAADDSIWPMFYAVVARDHVEGVFTGCTHLGRPPRVRRFYLFVVFTDEQPSSWCTDGVVHALPRAGFQREWGQEWVRADPVRPVLRVPVGPADFPLRDAVLQVSPRDPSPKLIRRLRAAKRTRPRA